MAHDGLVAVRQDDAQHVPLAPQLGMAEGVDPTPNRHQPPVGQAVVDRIATKAELEELPSRQHSVLTARQRMDLQLNRTLTAHNTV